jgi:hypothetical protein
MPTRQKEEAVQGAGMLGPFQAPGAAESDASVRPRVRSHVPGTRRDRAQADEAGDKKAESRIRLLPKESAYGLSSKGGSAHEPSQLACEWHCERLRRSQVVKILGVMRVRGLSFTPLNRPLPGSRWTWEHRSGIRGSGGHHESAGQSRQRVGDARAARERSSETS